MGRFVDKFTDVTAESRVKANVESNPKVHISLVMRKWFMNERLS